MDPRELGHSLRMAAIAVTSAVLTAAVVIGVGQSLIGRHQPVDAPVVRASLN